MPLNYLDLQPQIREYAHKAQQSWAQYRRILADARALLESCAALPPAELRRLCQENGERCALPVREAIDAFFPPAADDPACILLAADGSQITSSAHDAVPISLINTGLVCMDRSSQAAPQVSIQSRLLSEERDGVEYNLLSEDLISLRRDVAELDVLNGWQAPNDLPVIALRDGPLELFHEPRQGEAFQKEFENYVAGLDALSRRDFILAGYIDRSRANLLGKTLAIGAGRDPKDLAGLQDTTLLSGLLPAGQRSAIFELQSSGSQHYPQELRIHFFYLNVGANGKDYIVRVEIPAWVAGDSAKVERLHAQLLSQCRMLGSRPYPYLLHRAHETAVVHFDEKSQLQDALSTELQRQGLDVPQSSNKLSAKALQKRTRM